MIELTLFSINYKNSVVNGNRSVIEVKTGLIVHYHPDSSNRYCLVKDIFQ
jgi:hypothetical protein